MLPVSFVLLAWLYFHEHTSICLLLSPFVLYQLIDVFHYQRKVYTELEQFTEAVHYRDFSRQFDVSRASAELQPLRKSFNNITFSFKQISKEKEIQYQYLQQILEIVGTGIISYEQSEGTIAWMNEAFKKMFNLPHFKNIHALEKRNKQILHEIISIPVGESKLINAYVDKSTFKVLLSANAFQIDQKVYKLLTLQNVNEAMEETESNAWSRLLSVMTHEIMNSIAPISSLASTLKNRIEDSIINREIQPSYREDLEVGINTIRKRSDALLKFADIYRNLNKIKTLNLERLYVEDLFESQKYLMMPTLTERNISFEIIVKDPDLYIEADENLLEQVLINLIVNAIEAVKNSEKPKIVLSAHAEGKKVVMKVSDNGNGIPVELLDKIFVPFFSTRKTGSGIGLNLCKQIIMLHKGSINFQTIEGVGTSFIMTL
ncbi:MAG: integral rane sensor signal transduction histidine kinase [Sphingobacteriales bacterium]|nr:integral rane sensor signal transduction histidine kinase [Sphingobacteriales bacterium]